jgi:hypothetical protein
MVVVAEMGSVCCPGSSEPYGIVRVLRANARSEVTSEADVLSVRELEAVLSSIATILASQFCVEY